MVYVYVQEKTPSLPSLMLRTFRPSNLNVRGQLIILDTHLDALDARLQELPRLQTRPDLDHRQVAGPQDGAAALRAELAEDGERTREQIQIRIQRPSNPLQQQNAQHDVDEVALEPHVVVADHTQHLVQDIADLDISQRETCGS